MPTPVELSIILVSHNTQAVILEALKSVYDTVMKHTYEVIVVENASSDGSDAVIKEAFPKVTLIKTKDLIGFAEANNLGRESAHGKYLFFLNPDTEVLPGSVDTLVDHMIEGKLDAASGQLLNVDRSVQPQGGALPNLLNVKAWMFFLDDVPLLNMLFTPYQQSRKGYFQSRHDNVGWVGGTALMVSAKAFDAVGGWDNKIFLYAEDVELCIRLHQAGYRISLFPDVQIVHKRHGSMGSSKTSLINEVSGLVYIWKKHFPAWQLPILRLILWIGSWLRVLVFGILLRDDTRKAAYLEAQKRARMA